MIRNLLRSLYSIIKFKGTRQEKKDLFFVLNKLKERQSKKIEKGSLVHESILKFSVSAYDYWTLHYLFNEIFVNKEYDFEPQTKSPLIIDCGANIGMATLYFKWAFPEASILAFEPNPNSFSLLEKNVRDNNLDNVEIFNSGLSNEDGEIPFFIDSYNPGTLIGSVKKKRGGPGELKVQITKLSNYISRYEQVDLVKMDIEGAEFDVISDLSSSGMIHRVKEFIIEYHHNIPGEDSNFSKFLELFESNGFSYNIKSNFSKLKSFQDVLIHFYK